MKCEIVRDLIPMYIDKTASKETAKEISDHLKECEDCKKFYNMCKKNEKLSISGTTQKIVDKIKNSGCEISDVDKQYADLSKKLKKRKQRQIIIGVVLLVSMLTYITFDIILAVKRKSNKN